MVRVGGTAFEEGGEGLLGVLWGTVRGCSCSSELGTGSPPQCPQSIAWTPANK